MGTIPEEIAEEIGSKRLGPISVTDYIHVPIPERLAHNVAAGHFLGLAETNDNGMTFTEIAAFIRENWEHL